MSGLIAQRAPRAAHWPKVLHRAAGCAGTKPGRRGGQSLDHGHPGKQRPSRVKALGSPLAAHTAEQPPESRPPSSEAGPGSARLWACFTDVRWDNSHSSSSRTPRRPLSPTAPSARPFTSPPLSNLVAIGPAYSSFSDRFRCALMTSPSGVAPPFSPLPSAALDQQPLSSRLVVERFLVP